MCILISLYLLISTILIEKHFSTSIYKEIISFIESPSLEEFMILFILLWITPIIFCFKYLSDLLLYIKDLWKNQ
jgi:hypothetical protein